MTEFYSISRNVAG